MSWNTLGWAQLSCSIKVVQPHMPLLLEDFTTCGLRKKVLKQSFQANVNNFIRESFLRTPRHERTCGCILIWSTLNPHAVPCSNAAVWILIASKVYISRKVAKKSHIYYSTWNVFNFSFKILALIIFIIFFALNFILRFYFQDTRTHVVVELFNTEKSYVESLQTIVMVILSGFFYLTLCLQFEILQKYLNPLKLPESSGIVDLQTVDEIFFMVPSILHIHEKFLEELRKRLDSWDPLQRVGDSYFDVVSLQMSFSMEIY